MYPTRAGSLYISANTPHFWSALCELIGLAELAADPQYDSVRKRAERAADLVPKIRAALQAHSASEWESIFGDRVPCAAAREIEDMFDHPQVLAEGLVAAFDHPTVGRYRGLSRAIRFGDAAPQAPSAAPTFGQHSDEVMAALGYTPSEITELRAAGVLGRDGAG